MTRRPWATIVVPGYPVLLSGGYSSRQYLGNPLCNIMESMRLTPNPLMTPGFPPGGCPGCLCKVAAGHSRKQGTACGLESGEKAWQPSAICRANWVFHVFFPSRPCLRECPVAATLHVRQTAPEQEAARLQARGKRINPLTNLTRSIMKRDEAIRDITTKFAELLAITTKPHRNRQLK